MSKSHESKVILSVALLTVITLGTTACSRDNLPDEFAKASNSLIDNWSTSCLENPQRDADTDAPTGYFRETFKISGVAAVQTFEYFQDSTCVIPVTSNQVADENETFFLRKQSQRIALNFPTEKQTTVLGDGYFLDLQVISVAIDDRTLTEAELQQNGIELLDLQALYVITDSDRLHIGASTDTRPTTVPLDYFYTRVAE